jgi:dihydropteroate synthase
MSSVGSFARTLEEAVARRGVLLLGVCNVTPDSFSDGGELATPEAAFARIDALVAEGADMIDVGGESSRPGAVPVSAREQLARVLEVVRHAAQSVPVSIDTTNAEVAEACLDAGACAVNDVSCARAVDLAQVAARKNAAYFLMHARGTQQEMRDFSTYPDDAYGDVVIDVLGEWSEAAARVRDAGVTELVMDPGLGFAKNARHSAELLRRLREIVSSVSAPVLVGASRKSFLKSLVADESDPKDRVGASLAAALFAREGGARVLRVHDVRATRQVLDAFAALQLPAPTDTERSLKVDKADTDETEQANADH